MPRAQHSTLSIDSASAAVFVCVRSKKWRLLPLAAVVSEGGKVKFCGSPGEVVAVRDWDRSHNHLLSPLGATTEAVGAGSRDGMESGRQSGARNMSGRVKISPRFYSSRAWPPEAFIYSSRQNIASQFAPRFLFWPSARKEQL